MSDTPRCDNAISISDLARTLERENTRLREALTKCIGVLSGEDMNKSALIDALRDAEAVLK